MSDDQGPWGPRDGRPAQPAPAPTAARAAAIAPAASPNVWVNLLSTALLAALLWFRMGWMWALAGVVGVFVHEYGHVVAMNLLGCGPARIRIIPFLGGAAIPAREPATEFRGVLIALAGPAVGLLAMAPFFAAYAWGEDPQWLSGAFFVALINLLNLAPAPPLDGSKALGPALAWVHPGLERAAVVLIGGAAAAWLVWQGSWIVGTFIGIATLGALRNGVYRPPMIRMTSGEWVASLALYAAVTGACLFALATVLLNLGAPLQPDALLARVGLVR